METLALRASDHTPGHEGACACQVRGSVRMLNLILTGGIDPKLRRLLGLPAEPPVDPVAPYMQHDEEMTQDG